MQVKREKHAEATHRNGTLTQLLRAALPTNGDASIASGWCKPFSQEEGKCGISESSDLQNVDHLPCRGSGLRAEIKARQERSAFP
jgi:hypothetical protein